MTDSFSQTPPATPWGINFGGGLNSTALIVEARNRGLRPDWIVFSDTGSERPETIAHVEHMRKWAEGWADIVTVRWIRRDGSFQSIHDNCTATKYLPSKAYGLAGCTMKWKVQPMERWRKEHGFDRGCFAVGYDAGEHRRIAKACQRGDPIGMFPWYPLVAWGIDREGCNAISRSAGFVVGKSSCFMCPNLRREEWRELRGSHPDLFEKALEIERLAKAAGNFPATPRRGMTSLADWSDQDAAQTNIFPDNLEDRCIHGGCFT